MKKFSRAFLRAQQACSLGDPDPAVGQYSKKALFFTPDTVLKGRDEIARLGEGCKVAVPDGFKGLRIIRVLESIVKNTVYYRITVRPPGFKDYVVNFSLTVCRSKIVRALTTFDATELERK